MNALAAAAGCLGFVAVGLGAFGAHALRNGFSPEAKGWWETATLYMMVHAVAALACAIWGVKGAGWAFVVGAAIFAGALYGLALGAPRFLGAVTPIGGVAMLIGWALVVAAALSARSA